jgi:hypothetical protein
LGQRIRPELGRLSAEQPTAFQSIISTPATPINAGAAQLSLGSPLIDDSIRDQAAFGQNDHEAIDSRINELMHRPVDRELAARHGYDAVKMSIEPADVVIVMQHEAEQGLVESFFGASLGKPVRWYTVFADQIRFPYGGHIHEYSDHYDIFVRHDLVRIGVCRS